MRKLIYCFTIIILASNFSCCTAQKRVNTKCDTKELASIEEKINSLKSDEIKSFILSVDEQCKNNVEFSEFHNELLFKVTSLYPAEILKSIANLDDVKKQILMTEYSSSVMDVDIIDLKKKIASVDGFDKIKKEIYQALDLNK